MSRGSSLEAASARAAASPDGTTLDEDARELLQTRTQRFGMLLGIVSGGFLLYRFTDFLFGTHGSVLEQGASLVPHGIAASTFLLMWLLTWKKRRSGRFLRRLEGAGFIIGCTSYAAMGPGIPVYIKPEMIVLMAMALTIFGRAGYIPSSGKRTALYAALVAVPLLISTWGTYEYGFEPAVWASVDPDFAAVPKHLIVTGRVINTGVWWLACASVASLTSQVIYGLRRDIREVRRLGRYELEERLGEGGMGEVYRAKHALLERPTAVKLLPLEASGARSTQFEREVQLTAQLGHPNTVTIFDYGRTADGVFYYAMELIDGLTLEQLVEVDGPVPAARAIHFLREATGALVEAHGVGLIHRDIKPANIMVSLPHVHGGVNELTKVLDFGLAKDIRAIDAEGSQVDTLRGTPLYMAPEAIKSPSAIDGRSDLYALGAVAYFLLTGEAVFDGSTVIEVCSKHLYEPPPTERLALARAPRELEELVLRCLSKAPGDRPASALEVLQALESLSGAHPWSAEDAAAWWSAHRGDTERVKLKGRRPNSGVRAITVTRTQAALALSGPR